jgi:competence protein ComEA
MDELKLKISKLLSGQQPVSKKLFFSLIGLVAAVVFVINSATATPSSVQTIQPTVGANQASVAAPVILVHVVGEVLRPGIYQLDSGARVVDAIFAAGGMTAKAEQSSINLARSLSDGEQLLVNKIGQVQGLGSASSAASSLISLNRASQAELESLPGVGPALAGRMIDWRLANGGFKKKEDLLGISGIGDKLFAGIKNLVTL